jgi:2-keto-4-pentenoate hydratase/2-oxohepta-3-ene-1,7-dioic acid hydratase in catechol pathway
MRAEGDDRPSADLWSEVEQLAAGLEASEPFMYVAPPSALSGANDDIILWKPGRCHDWELELTIVIGRHGRNVPEASAMDYVAGYTISNDISTRDVMHRAGFPLTDFLTSKCRPGFLPTGPCVVPKEFVADPSALQLRLMVNGELMQDERLDDMIHGVGRLVSYASRVSELRPGDLILTGSPAGNAAHHGDRWLAPGDVIEGGISGLGSHRNLCVRDPGA